MLDDLMPIFGLLLIFTSFVSYNMVVPHFGREAFPQEVLDGDTAGAIKKAKAFLIWSLIVSSTILAILIILVMIFSEPSSIHIFGIPYITAFILLRKSFISALRSKRPFYQLIEEMEESSTLTKWIIMFIGTGPVVVPVTWSVLGAIF
jgi:hypothetical protein